MFFVLGGFVRRRSVNIEKEMKKKTIEKVRIDKTSVDTGDWLL